jgi:transposase
MSHSASGGETPPKQNRYTQEFRDRAIDLVVRQGYAVAKAAESLGVKFHTMDYWVRNHRREHRVETAMSEADKDKLLEALRRENAELKVEKEILKKAAAFFAKESSR